MKLLLGTNNPSKLEGMKQMIHACAPKVVCVSPAEAGVTSVQPPEDEPTAIENAVQKALAWHAATGLPVLAEDSGLVFLDLPLSHPDQPGIHVRRMDGSDWMDDDRMIAWYSAIAHRHGGRLRACWQDAWCIVEADGNVHRYVVPGELLEARAYWLVDSPCAARTQGWPLDSLSVMPALGGIYKAEMTAEDQARLTALRGDIDAQEQAARDLWLAAHLAD